MVIDGELNDAELITMIAARLGWFILVDDHKNNANDNSKHQQ